MTAATHEVFAAADDHRRVVIIDDDPTGTHTASDIDVVLRPDTAAFDAFLRGPRKAVFALSNTRALPRSTAAAMVSGIAEQARTAARATGQDIAFLLRGDSALRGHVFPEMEAVAQNTSGLFVPAFLERGRFTRDGVHYVSVDGTAVPAADTEFARDSVFGYRSHSIADWVDEVTQGRWKARTVGLDALRERGYVAVRDALFDAGPHEVVVPDATEHADLETISEGLIAAERSGKSVVTRCGVSFASVRACLRSRTIDEAKLSGRGRLLVICGSVSETSTRQVDALGELANRRIEISTAASIGGCPDMVGELTTRITAELDVHGVAMLSTERSEHLGPDTPIMLLDSIAEIVSVVAREVDSVIVKGGITSSRVATDGFRARHATVAGQLMPGVPLWLLENRPFVVVPGSVGEDDALRRLVSAFAG
ncbi:four-carbon acid sugar kinase family protein [Allokutzneria sp. NRRL B-24872]|uniref:four-carbon acid sugar kinase family protein n=1 Tax=Allokutzneria sp. NRRL B-24872 TaxID=1137961 RepID=UPI000A3C57D1|nr:four-carbon acid sugar kinase family protein [Allokutzneria sp. NRRL B-24872]